MSISPRPEAQQFPQGNESSEDELEPTRPPLDGDVAVEVLSDKHPSPTSARRPTFPHRLSSSSTSPSEEEYESDVTFRPPLERERLRRLQHPMQPTSIEHPHDASARDPHAHDTPTVEFESPLKRKHLRLDDERPHASKRHRFHVDEDVAMDPPNIASGPGWYEPEKDRIVVTSLSSPEPSSRSPSPDPGPRRPYSFEEHKHLTQPGADGFTISPSLLTHLMAAQSDQFTPAYNAVPERGLVLYRPLGIPPAEHVVKQWDEEPGRFEEVDDDEDMSTEPSGNQWGDDIAQQWEQNDDAMDIE
ncbi:hypothetical protein CC85DRAFT_305770 [Cutaneotrichosporon oleaginosum]|uniref:Uncharacterized protein n=1 Tax=Cutaneotrichosporon oleaginosum TaxID=879819 RepID=A0A0J0XC79_9TREE|nr:uncharacterized protein CC85DRAFT_305770 [Cutaneotrichosporon oleaginosum]KLT38657.1 hypothetical protein CC85DRAFT_305770 [Cutaneotrichosporon oleaginosum]TXT08282.1 hypothetical protein COLE_05206 [Cutaneotrichosporon oleaginosum]